MAALAVAMLMTMIAGAGDKPTVAVIPKGTTHSFWKTVHAGAAAAGKKLNADIIWQGPQREDDRNMQIQVVQNFISRGVDAIVLAPLDDKALARPVKRAVKKGLKVVIFDSALSADDYVSFVATDNFKGGELCAKRLCEVMNGSGKALMMRYNVGSASTHKREEGFLAGMRKHGPDIELVSTNQYGGATAGDAFKTAQNLLNRFGSDLDGVYCPNESTTYGMLRALKTSGKAGKVKFVGFDSSDALIKALKAGEINGLALQNPYKMGYEAVQAAVDALNGKKIDKRIDTGVVMVTKENLNEPAVQKLLNPGVEDAGK